MGPNVRRIVTLAMPVAINLSMPVVFRGLGQRLRPQRGYIAGFVVCWSASIAIPVIVLGPGRTGGC